jgi:glycosyltransferase involved in cell wall biosynthesis
MSRKPRILVLASHYLPGYKAGGPIRSVSGMVESLGDEFDFRVLTSDRDLGDTEPYPGIVGGAWTSVGKAQVMYLPRTLMCPASLSQILRETPYDIAYLGGGFDPLFVLPFLLLRRLGLARKWPVVLAPQGVFSEGALHIKAFKKQLFLAAASQIGLYDSLIWHVTSEFEKRDVRRALRLHSRERFIFVRPNIVAASHNPPPLRRSRSSGQLQVVFLSRISPKKNLDGALRILQGVDVPLAFHIYGPAEDDAYWRLCEHEMQKLPPNVLATYHGPIAHADVAAMMQSHDLFFLPTHGENFGHVIIEALREGCPALIANNTAFRNLESQNAGWDLPLDDVEGFRRVLHQCATMSPEEWLCWSEGACRLAGKITTDEGVTNKYRAAFRELAAMSRTARAA